MPVIQEDILVVLLHREARSFEVVAQGHILIEQIRGPNGSGCLLTGLRDYLLWPLLLVPDSYDSCGACLQNLPLKMMNDQKSTLENMSWAGDIRQSKKLEERY